MPFVLEAVVQAGEIDRLDHASNQVYLRWVLEAALAHTTALGLPEEAYLARGQAWVVRKHELTYLRPAMLGDRLRVETRVTTMSVASSVRKTRIFRDQLLLVEAVTDWVYVALPSGRPVRIPAEIGSRFPVEE